MFTRKLFIKQWKVFRADFSHVFLPLSPSYRVYMTQSTVPNWAKCRQGTLILPVPFQFYEFPGQAPLSWFHDPLWLLQFSDLQNLRQRFLCLPGVRMHQLRGGDRGRRRWAGGKTPRKDDWLSSRLWAGWALRPEEALRLYAVLCREGLGSRGRTAAAPLRAVAHRIFHTLSGVSSENTNTLHRSVSLMGGPHCPARGRASPVLITEGGALALCDDANLEDLKIERCGYSEGEKAGKGSLCKETWYRFPFSFSSGETKSLDM